MTVSTLALLLCIFCKMKCDAFLPIFVYCNRRSFERNKMLDFILLTVFGLVYALAGKLVDLVFLGWSHYCITFPDLVTDLSLYFFLLVFFFSMYIITYTLK